MEADALTATHEQCGHSFHRECYDQYRRTQPKFQIIYCLMCRQPVESAPGGLHISEENINNAVGVVVLSLLALVGSLIFYATLCVHAAYGLFSSKVGTALSVLLALVRFIDFMQAEQRRLQHIQHRDGAMLGALSACLAVTGLFDLIGVGLYSFHQNQVLGYVYYGALIMLVGEGVICQTFGRRAAKLWRKACWNVLRAALFYTITGYLLDYLGIRAIKA